MTPSRFFARAPATGTSSPTTHQQKGFHHPDTVPHENAEAAAAREKALLNRLDEFAESCIGLKWYLVCRSLSMSRTLSSINSELEANIISQLSSSK
jgi:hypothetical protein